MMSFEPDFKEPSTAAVLEPFRCEPGFPERERPTWDFVPHGLTCRLLSPAGTPATARHSEVELYYLPAGSLTYMVGGRSVVVEAGRIVLFWAAVPHQIVERNCADPYYVITLPLGWFLSCGFPDEFARRTLSGEMVMESAGSLGDNALFSRWAEDLQSATVARERAAQIEIQARLLRLALAQPPADAAGRTATEGSPPPALSRADQIACYIARYYAEPLTSEQIAKAVGLHPNYAMNVFRKAFGITMVNFLAQHRLLHAQHLLTTTDAPVIEIAASSGFQSLSRFNEVFKRACGCAPREYRRTNRGSLASSRGVTRMQVTLG